MIMSPDSNEVDLHGKLRSLEHLCIYISGTMNAYNLDRSGDASHARAGMEPLTGDFTPFCPL